MHPCIQRGGSSWSSVWPSWQSVEVTVNQRTTNAKLHYWRLQRRHPPVKFSCVKGKKKKLVFLFYPQCKGTLEYLYSYSPLYTRVPWVNTTNADSFENNGLNFKGPNLDFLRTFYFPFSGAADSYETFAISFTCNCAKQSNFGEIRTCSNTLKGQIAIYPFEM